MGSYYQLDFKLRSSSSACCLTRCNPCLGSLTGPQIMSQQRFMEFVREVKERFRSL